MARKPSKEALEKSAEALRTKLAETEAALKRIQDEEERKKSLDPKKVFAYRALIMSAIPALKAIDPDSLPTALVDLPTSAWPRDATLLRRFDISETEAEQAKDRGRKAVEGL